MATRARRSRSTRKAPSRSRAYTENREVGFPRDAREVNRQAWQAERTGRNRQGRFASRAERTVNVYTRTASGQLSADGGQTHSGYTNGLTQRASRAQGGGVVRQAVSNGRGGKVDRNEARQQLENSYMNRNTARRLVRAGLITQQEANSMVRPRNVVIGRGGVARMEYGGGGLAGGGARRASGKG